MTEPDDTDRAAFFEAVQEIRADYDDDDMQAVFDDARLRALFHQYGFERAVGWAHLALVRESREVELAQRQARLWKRIAERGQSLPEDTRIGDIMDDQEIDRLVAECGLSQAADGSFVLLEDS